MMHDGAAATTPTMVTTLGQLTQSTEAMAREFPDAHGQILAALGRVMKRDGVMEFTVSALAKDSDIRLRVAKEYLRVARQRKILHVLGRRTDNGRIRYCAYETLVKAHHA